MKKLTLRSETVRALSNAQLGEVNGAGYIKTYVPYNCASVQTCTGTVGCPTAQCTLGPCATTVILDP